MSWWAAEEKAAPQRQCRPPLPKTQGSPGSQGKGPQETLSLVVAPPARDRSLNTRTAVPASPAQLCFPCDPRGDLLKARRKNWASLQIVLCTANCIAVRILILPVCSALVPRITCGILDYLCLNKRLGNLKKKNVCEMARAMSMEESLPL